MANTKRIVMNSESLQKTFPDIYRELFSQCPLVTSALGAFWFAGEYSVLYGGLALLQKVPLKYYVGIMPLDTARIVDVDGYVFIPSKQSFVPFDLSFSKEIRQHLLAYLEEQARLHYGSDTFPGFSIKSVIEIPISSGINASAAFAVALATAFLLHTGQITSEDVRSLEYLSVSALAAAPLAQKIFRFAWKLETIFHGGPSSGSAAFAALAHSYYPILYRTGNRFYGKKARTHYDYHSADVLMKDIEKLPYTALGLDELGNISGEIPLDFALIYSGEAIRTSMIVKSLAYLNEMLDDTQHFIRKKKLFSDTRFAHTILSPDHMKADSLWMSYIHSVSNTALEVLHRMYEVYSKGHSDTVLKNLTDAINAHHHALGLLDVSSDRLDYMGAFLVHEALRREVRLGCKISGAGKKGDILMVAPYHVLQNKCGVLIDRVRQEIGEQSIGIDYASWIDGIGKEGVCIEQDIAHKKYSSYVSKNSVRVQHCASDGILHATLSTQEAFEKKMPTLDLVLDNTRGAIFIRGKKLTSKDIYSARETIAILTILMRNAGMWVGQDQLPRSSYASDRNEMQSKILTPLHKALMQRTKHKLSLVSKGTATSFSLKLDPGTEIYLVESL